MSVVCVAVHCAGSIGAERLLQTQPTLITIKEVDEILIFGYNEWCFFKARIVKKSKTNVLIS